VHKLTSNTPLPRNSPHLLTYVMTEFLKVHKTVLLPIKIISIPDWHHSFIPLNIKLSSNIKCLLAIISIIGQACEFDYSGTQAVKTLKELGYRVVLINSNPATIMTDPEFADRTYIEPIKEDIIEKIIQDENVDAILKGCLKV